MMRAAAPRRVVRLPSLAVLWLLVAAAAPLPLIPPPPDLTRLVPFAEAPLDKPPVGIPDVARPATPAELPPVPPAPLTLPAAERLTAPVPAPRSLPCIGAFLRIPTELLECGRAHFGRGEYDEAVKNLDAAVRVSSEHEVTVEARYWLGEALLHLGRVEQADWTFRQGLGERPTLEYEVWAVHASGWTALALGDAARGRETFAGLLAGAAPPSIASWDRHGLALALYALRQYADAERAWAELERRGVPSDLAREVQFWHGETLGRLGEHARAAAELSRFTQGGSHPLLDNGWLRLGWWSLAGGRAAESVPAFRNALARGGTTLRADRAWADAGLALALSGAGDIESARESWSTLTAARSPLAVPVALKLVSSVLDAKKPAEAEGIVQETLAGTITPAVRSWLLIVRGDAFRLDGNRDEARTQYELAQQSKPPADLAPHAVFRLARINFEMREFAQSVTDLQPLVSASLPGDLRAAALLLYAEAAYRANDDRTAETAFRRVVVELPQHPEVATARLSLAWVALRQGRAGEARRLFVEFARLHPEHPSATDALVLASERTLASGDLDAARRELDQIIATRPMHPRTDFARLNRAILAVRTGRVSEAVPTLRDWIARAPFPPLLGRAHVAFGAALLAANAPTEAGAQFVGAQREGIGALATLGLGAVALAQTRPDDAARLFTEARDTGTADVVAVAEYGLAAVTVERGQLVGFKPLALAGLRAAPSGPMAPRLLYVLVGIAVEEKDWRGALDTARKLVADFPRDETADDALERVGAGAATAAAWPVAYDAYTLLRARYPSSPFVESSMLAFAEAQIETGHTGDARRVLEPLASGGATEPRAWVLLGKAREAAGDRRGAMEAYARAARDGTGTEFARDALLGHARLLAADRRWDQARAVLDGLMKSDDKAATAEAAFVMGETYKGEGDPLAAAEYYMTAAYLAPESSYGRRALLAAGQTLAAAKQPDAAAVVYGKLLAQSDVPADLADAARQGLASLGR